jgi:probable HAF family extracellular repeat protein
MPRVRRRSAVVAVGSLLGLVAAGCAVDLGTLGGHSSQALDINDTGVTVGLSTTADGDTHAFRKWPGRPMQDLNGSYVRSEAVAVNDSGVVLGSASTETEQHVVVWDRRGRPRDLGPGLPGDINNDGLVVGARDSTGFVWDPATGETTSLPDPPDPPDAPAFDEFLMDVRPTAINDEGAIVGQARFGTTRFQGVLWEAGTHEPVLLPPAKPRGPTGRLWSVPLDINDRGTIAGWANSGAYFAIVWRAGTLEPIDITPPGAGSATASGINNRGQVVGRAGSGPEWAFRWDPRTERAVDLGGLDGPSAVASEINESGIAAGWATTTDPPPPGQLATHAVIFLPRPQALPG